MKIIDKKFIAVILSEYISYFSIEELESFVEIPPDEFSYTYAFPCFRLAKFEKKSPLLIAEDLKNKIKLPESIESVEAEGPYLNFMVKSQIILNNITLLQEDYGRMREKDNPVSKSTVVIEYPSPNTNKPLHFGHIRNMLLGKSLSNLLIYKGYRVFQVNLNNDRGIHICKSMIAYKKWGQNEEPNIKSDHFVGNYYVKYNKMLEKNPQLENETRELLRLWEDGEVETRELWKKMNKWAFDGFKITYDKLGIVFDKEYFESNLYLKGKEIINEGLNKGLFETTEDGAIFARLKEKYNLEDKVLIRSDGTSIYITQDIYLAYIKKKDFDYDKSIYVVGDPQIQHFKWLFAILDLLGFKEDNFHLSYGMVDLPEGRMKSREGIVVDADDIISKVEKLALEEVIKRYPNLSEEKKKYRAEVIGMAALKFYILKFSAIKGFTFNPKESISFEGETGPYILYCFARINSIISKSGRDVDISIKWELLTHQTELLLLKQLTYFPEIINSAENSYNIHIIPQYLLSLCQSFNSFYSSCQVISENKELEKARLLLIKSVQVVIKIGLDILGIETLEQM
ncbi:MAG: arginine--tRNA ligase [Candidatus Lokiarchaeota archaeon]|nr:arginine--tRNA ligase [Candidatus Lokiarchaeota archaeon]